MVEISESLFNPVSINTCPNPVVGLIAHLHGFFVVGENNVPVHNFGREIIDIFSFD